MNPVMEAEGGLVRDKAEVWERKERNKEGIKDREKGLKKKDQEEGM